MGLFHQEQSEDVLQSQYEVFNSYFNLHCPCGRSWFFKRSCCSKLYVEIWFQKSKKIGMIQDYIVEVLELNGIKIMVHVVYVVTLLMQKINRMLTVENMQMESLHVLIKKIK